MSVDVLASLAQQVTGRAQREQAEERGWDMWLLLTVFVLIGFGLVMLYSASAVMASQRMAHHFHLVSNQLQKIVIGMALMVVALKVDYRWYQRLIYPIFGGTLAMLVMVLIPGIGTVQNGAQRWFSLAGFSFQPAEVAKIVAVMYLAYSVSKKGEKMTSFTVGFIPHLFMIGLMVALLMKQPDFGSSVILLSMMMIMIFVSGARTFYLGMFAGLGVLGAYIAVSSSEYRMDRIRAFLDPWSYRQGIGYQISESLIAIGSGGLEGRGLGNGTGKLGYVPELWNDFIGTIVAEELGILGVIVLVGLFGVFLWRGFKIAMNANDKFGAYLAFGITTMFGMQATANLCVVTGLLPTKGLTLPFVSFGGSSLIMAMFATGILLNISRGAPDMWEIHRVEREAERDARRWDKRRDKILRRREDLRDRFDD
jgi:cell division protein FtsW